MRGPAVIGVVCLGALAVGACGSTPGASERPPSQDAASEEPPPQDAASEEPSPQDAASEQPSQEDPARCLAAADVIASLVTDASCTALVVLSTVDRSVLGWYLDCGPIMPVTDAEARAAVDRSAFSGPASINSATTLTVPPPMNEFVYHAALGDFGGMAVVSARTGRMLVGGPLNWGIKYSGFLYPRLRPASEVPTVCAREELPNGRAVSRPLVPAPKPEVVRAVLDIVATTPVASALSRTLTITDALVVEFPADGRVNPTPQVPENQWLVFVNAEAQ